MPDLGARGLLRRPLARGYALGAGLELALACDMIIAAEGTKLGTPEIRMGSIAATVLPWLVGPMWAKRIILTGDHTDAYEAERIGLVNKVVPHDQLLNECFRIVERIALVSPETVKTNLVVATQGLLTMGLHSAWSLNTELSAIVHASQREDFKRHLEEAAKEGGMRAYLETRDAPFQPEPFGPRAAPKSES